MGFSPEEVNRLTLPQIENLIRGPEKETGGPKTSGLRKVVKRKRREAQDQAAWDAIRKSRELEKNKGK